MKKRMIEQILTLLIKEYGNPELQPYQSPTTVLIQTILSQNTSDINSHQALASLMATFSGWKNIADATTEEIAYAIRAGGLGETKARYIKQSLLEICRQRGDYELDFLSQFSLDKARDWLMQLPGVGMKTASCVLLFSLDMPALPVDTHIYRVTRRLELINSKISVDKAHILLENMIPRSDVYRFHILLIEHGRKVCKAQRPLCHQCSLNKICPTYNKIDRADRN